MIAIRTGVTQGRGLPLASRCGLTLGIRRTKRRWFVREAWVSTWHRVIQASHGPVNNTGSNPERATHVVGPGGFHVGG
jgi:hypothetical protein